jgi:membrane protein
LSKAAADWMEDNAARMGAALAFYSVLSLAPLLLLALNVAAFFFDRTEAQNQLLAQMADLVGKEGSEAIRSMVEAGTKTGSAVTTAITIATLLFGASGVFGELQAAMDAIWDVKPKSLGILGMLKARYLSFAMVLGTGFLLVVSLLVSTVIAGLHQLAGNRFPEMEILFQVLTFLVTFSLVTCLFALIYKILPDAEVSWKHAWTGAVLTSILFTVGKLAIGIYLGKSGLASSYGAAGSLVVLLVWTYYSAQIVFFGAEIAHALATSRGRQPQPSREATRSPSADPGRLSQPT